ncbi:aldo/keto reductase [Alkalicoccus halolimnae]|uniref:Aldo/keto reductase n=1 Tax=Alkalicoccus halolimnae TaxID=1667239 RepID=A0A5C7F711_9BACI|nr:aldo/keto reductase [Alkalicoccus halolimnae]TXF86482.1 aldo/keto reductase [Alkalicoccus halolimnae]
MKTITNRKLGSSDMEISPIGLGCWQFSKGSNAVGKYWDSLADEDMNQIIKVSIENGIDWFDTAEVYGNGASERVLAAALDEWNIGFDEVKLATKWWPLFRKAASIEKTIERRKDALNQRPIDLYQIHQPFSVSSIKNQMKAMAELQKQGKVRNIGVSNFNEKQMREAHAVLAEDNLPLVSNQVKYSLLDRRIEKNGLLAAAKELETAVIAYSPLEQGLLSGKYHDNPEMIKKTSGPRKWMGKFKENQLPKTEPLVSLLKEYADQYNVTVSQIVLNWMINYHGSAVFVIPGASKVKQAEENAGAMTFSLTGEELEQISEEAWKVQLYK